MPETKQSAGAEATEKRMDAFGELDVTLHGGDEVDVKSISKEITTQITKLQATR